VDSIKKLIHHYVVTLFLGGIISKVKTFLARPALIGASWYKPAQLVKPGVLNTFYLLSVGAQDVRTGR